MKVIECECEWCLKDDKKGICFKCNVGSYHYACRKCFKKLKGAKK